MGDPATARLDGTAVTAYEIRFRARSSEPLPDDTASRLTRAVDDTPSAELTGSANLDTETATVESAFVIDVATDKMVDAARYGSRLAKESLWSAGVDAKLVELQVTRSEE